MRTLHLFSGLMARSPMAAGQMLIGLDFHLGPVEEIAVVGERDNAEVIDGAAAVAATVSAAPGDGVEAAALTEGSLPLLKDRPALGRGDDVRLREFHVPGADRWGRGIQQALSRADGIR